MPGVGSYGVNVGSGNGILIAPDMVVPHRGVPLTFTRVYNNQSTHTWENGDGTIADQYGQLWTNEWDQRIANNTAGGISYFDAAGARWDFTPVGILNPCLFTSPPGMFAT